MKTFLKVFLFLLALSVCALADTGTGTQSIRKYDDGYYLDSRYIYDIDRYTCTVNLDYVADEIIITVDEQVVATYYNKSYASCSFDTKDPDQYVKVEVYYSGTSSPSVIGTWDVELK